MIERVKETTIIISHNSIDLTDLLLIGSILLIIIYLCCNDDN